MTELMKSPSQPALGTATEDRVDEARSMFAQFTTLTEASLPAYLSRYQKSLKSLAQQKDPADGSFLLDRFTKSEILKQISKKEFKDLSTKFQALPSGKANLAEFLSIFLTTVAIPSSDIFSKLSCIVALLDLFQEVAGPKKYPFITWKEVSSEILTGFVEGNHFSEFGISNKYVYKSDALKRCLSPRAMSEV